MRGRFFLLLLALPAFSGCSAPADDAEIPAVTPPAAPMDRTLRMELGVERIGAVEPALDIHDDRLHRAPHALALLLQVAQPGKRATLQVSEETAGAVLAFFEREDWARHPDHPGFILLRDGAHHRVTLVQFAWS